jgi:hypothetical protein
MVQSEEIGVNAKQNMKIMLLGFTMETGRKDFW